MEEDEARKQPKIAYTLLPISLRSNTVQKFSSDSEEEMDTIEDEPAFQDAFEDEAEEDEEGAEEDEAEDQGEDEDDITGNENEDSTNSTTKLDSDEITDVGETSKGNPKLYWRGHAYVRYKKKSKKKEKEKSKEEKEKEENEVNQIFRCDKRNSGWRDRKKNFKESAEKGYIKDHRFKYISCSVAIHVRLAAGKYYFIKMVGDHSHGPDTRQFKAKEVTALFFKV